MNKTTLIAFSALLILGLATVTITDADADSKRKKGIFNFLFEMLDDHEARIADLETKTTPIRINENNNPTPISGQQGHARIFLAGFDDPDCTLNLVDTEPFSGKYVQLGWCPPSGTQTFIIPTQAVTPDSVIDITIVDNTQNRLVNCWTSNGKNYTLGDGQTAEIRVIEGFQVECNMSIAQGMDMLYTITNP